MRTLRFCLAVALATLSSLADADLNVNQNGGVIEDTFDPAGASKKQDFFTKLPTYFPKGDKGDPGFVGFLFFSSLMIVGADPRATVVRQVQKVLVVRLARKDPRAIEVIKATLVPRVTRAILDPTRLSVFQTTSMWTRSLCAALQPHAAAVRA